MAYSLVPWCGPHQKQISLSLRFDVARLPQSLDFTFRLSAEDDSELDQLVLASTKLPSERERCDELWKKTCFEIFFAEAKQKKYYEMNLSPNGDWNIYAFDSYRAGSRAVVGATSPWLEFDEARTGATELVWRGQLRAEGEMIDAIRSTDDLLLSATSVLEFRDREKEYWALKHAGDKPDFHLRESFTIRLPKV